MRPFGKKITKIVFGMLFFTCNIYCQCNILKEKKMQYSIIGEINQPGIYFLPDSALTLTDAIATAGDMTVFGMRNKVKLIRNNNKGKPSIHFINLDKNDNTSPYNMVQSGDVIYIQPSKAKTNTAKIGKRSTIWVSILSSLISVGTLIITKLK